MDTISIDLITLISYFVIMLIVGSLVAKYNVSASDFIRCNGQVPWWLNGIGICMTSISAYVFTGSGSAAFNAGPTVLVLYVGTVVSLVVGGYYFAAWVRKTSAYTATDIVRMRFGVSVEQFSAYASVLIGPFSTAIQLWALSVFASAVYGYSVQTCILVIGSITLTYSIMGGKWAVLTSDFLQGILLFSITLLVAVLCYIKIGGFEVFFSYFDKPEFAQDFQLIKEPNQFKNSEFSLHWVIFIFFMTFCSKFNLSAADSFLSAENGAAARRSAYFAALLIGIGSLIWLFPPMVARFLYAEEILAQNIKDPATTAYIFIATKVLPEGLLGLLSAGMFAATMSSMDAGFNRQAGILTRNIVPRLRSITGFTQPLSSKQELLLCKFLTLLVGLLVLTYSVYFATAGSVKLFNAFQTVSSYIGTPLLFPLFIALLVKRIPSWSYFIIFTCCMMPSVVSLYEKINYSTEWTIQDRIMWIFIAGFLGTILSMLLYRYSSVTDKERAEVFFELRNFSSGSVKNNPVSDTPLHNNHFEKHQLVKLLGFLAISSGLASLLFLFFQSTLESRLMVLFIATFFSGIGALMVYFVAPKSN